jgi:hypothetical protein
VKQTLLLWSAVGDRMYLIIQIFKVNVLSRYVMQLALFYAFFWVIPRYLNFICQHFGTLSLFHLHTYLPMKMEQTECSKTSTYKIQTPRNYPEENIQHSEHGESMIAIGTALQGGLRITRIWKFCLFHVTFCGLGACRV